MYGSLGVNAVHLPLMLRTVVLDLGSGFRFSVLWFGIRRLGLGFWLSAAAGDFAETVPLNYYVTNIFHCSGTQPQSLPDMREKRTPVAIEWGCRFVAGVVLAKLLIGQTRQGSSSVIMLFL